MKSFYKVAFAALALAAGSAVQATTLTFDALTGVYGDGSPLGANMVGDSQYLSYTESGYVLTLHTTNDPSATFGAHIGDGTFNSGTYNWHDSGDNLVGAYITLTKVGGGSFTLQSFYYLNTGTGLTVDTGSGPVFLGTGPNTYFSDGSVTSVTFSSTDYSSNQLDNIVLSGGVPEPATWGLMLVGFGAVGVAARRRSVAISA